MEMLRENPASVSHGTIYDTDREDGRNIVLLGVDGRQSHIYNLLKSTHLDKDSCIPCKGYGQE